MPSTLDNFGGATPPPDGVIYLSGYSAQNSSFEFLGDLNPYGLRYLTGDIGNNVDRQINVTGTVSRFSGEHQMKFGVDYRRLSPQQGLAAYGQQALFLTLPNVMADNLAEAFVVAKPPTSNSPSTTGVCSPRTHGKRCET